MLTFAAPATLFAQNVVIPSRAAAFRRATATEIQGRIDKALAAPSAVITPGYGMATVTLKTGSTLAGTLLAETPDKLTLRQPDGVEITANTTEIEVRTPPISVMPPMHGILTPRQIRDVVAYLTTLNAKPGKATESEH